MDNLAKIHTIYQQSPWLDNLSRDLTETDQLQTYISQGIRGLTSNPTIMEKAIIGSDRYSDDIAQLVAKNLDSESIYWELVKKDIRDAAKLFLPLWQESNGQDGYVSLEVSPTLARDAEATLRQARELWNDLQLPNLMIKVPATSECIPVIHTLLSEGVNVNITLIFSLDHYEEVAAAHKASHRLGMINNSRSVASFFVSRIDSEVDARLEAIATDQAQQLKGKTAVAQARLAYQIFLDQFADLAVLSPESTGIQRLLWASTSTKDESYNPLLYVESLLAPYTVNTLPEATVQAISDTLSEDSRTLTLEDIDDASRTMNKLADVGIDMKDVVATLEKEAVQKFQESFSHLLATIDQQR